MNTTPNFLSKFRYALPWLSRYPFERAIKKLNRSTDHQKLIFLVANHFEPSWKPSGFHSQDVQLKRLDAWRDMARSIGESVKDFDGTKFRHTNFYPGEQYDPRILDRLAEMQNEGLGEVEIHLHHGVNEPDTSENLRHSLLEFRDRLAEEHKCLSRMDGIGDPKYAFVHGNLALANSAGGRYCGVDNEMRILQETGCYADMTLPSAPDRTQVPVFNEIYQCGLPLDQAVPHRKGMPLRVGVSQPELPVIFTGPLVFNWTRKIKGIPVPRIEDGALVASQPMDLARLNRWINADIRIRPNSSWVFIKLYCHGFFDHDQSACIGEGAKRFFSEIIENGLRNNSYTVHFVSAREAFNLVSAAVDGKDGEPNEYRDYKLKTIMSQGNNGTL